MSKTETTKTLPNSALYFYKADDANEMSETECRLQGFHELNTEVLDDLQQMLDENNTYMRIFRSVRGILDDDRMPEPKPVLYANTRPDREHARRYNLPANGLIGAIVIRDVAELMKKNDIVLERKGDRNENNFEKRITSNQTNQAYVSLCHPILFPNGQNGWHFEI